MEGLPALELPIDIVQHVVDYVLKTWRLHGVRQQMHLRNVGGAKRCAHGGNLRESDVVLPVAAVVNPRRQQVSDTRVNVRQAHLCAEITAQTANLATECLQGIQSWTLQHPRMECCRNDMYQALIATPDVARRVHVTLNVADDLFCQRCPLRLRGFGWPSLE